jgi:glycogen phosphorylase
VQAFLDEIDPDAVRVELYAEVQKDKDASTVAMDRGERVAGAKTGFTYNASIPKNRPVGDFTPRLIPQHTGASVPLEAGFILWHPAPSWR